MIDVENLSYVYPEGQVAAVRSITFRVEEGEVFGFLGPSGAGKSTTQKILIGLLRDYEGRVAVLGRDFRDWGHDYYERIGVSFELPNHYLKLTALENLDYFRSLYERATDEPRQLLKAVGLDDDADKRVGQFSKGMRIRLNLARALLHRPDLLFLDERDDRTLTALAVTPMPLGGYLLYCITMPLLLGFLITVVGYPLAGLAPLPIVHLVFIALVAALNGPVTALFLAAFAENKVSGFALVKVLNTINMLPVAAYFVDMPWQVAAGVVPAYWPMRMLWQASAGEGYLLYGLAGAAVSAAAVGLLLRRFRVSMRR